VGKQRTGSPKVTNRQANELPARKPQDRRPRETGCWDDRLGQTQNTNEGSRGV